MRKNAFTLIEVMVVLSVLAIIAILSYNFFGSVIKEATLTKQAAELHRQAQVITDAYQEYIRKTGVILPTDSWANKDILKDALVDEGVIREFPYPTSDMRSSAGTCTEQHSPGGPRGWDVYTSNFVATSVPEFTVSTKCLKEDLCRKYNELYGEKDINDSFGTIPVWNAWLGTGTVCGPASGGQTAQDFQVVFYGEIN